MRVFVAIFPPPEVREALVRAARDLPIRGDVRWLPESNIHLTLKFLGEIPEDLLEGIGEALEAVSERHEAFEVEPSRFGAFPSGKKARVVWAGVGEGSERLRQLAEDLDALLEPLGFEREKRGYTPHITLGRARGRPVKLEPAENAPGIPRFPAHRLELMQSVLGRKGAVYSMISACPLISPP